MQESLTAKEQTGGGSVPMGTHPLCSLSDAECRAQHCFRGFRVRSWAGLPQSSAYLLLEKWKASMDSKEFQNKMRKDL